MSARALDALSQLDPLTQLVVGQIYGFTGAGPKSADLVSAEMGLTKEEVSTMLEAGLRALAGYRKPDETPSYDDDQKKTAQYSKPTLALVRRERMEETKSEKLKMAKG